MNDCGFICENKWSFRNKNVVNKKKEIAINEEWRNNIELCFYIEREEKKRHAITKKTLWCTAFRFLLYLLLAGSISIAISTRSRYFVNKTDGLGHKKRIALCKVGGRKLRITFHGRKCCWTTYIYQQNYYSFLRSITYRQYLTCSLVSVYI